MVEVEKGRQEAEKVLQPPDGGWGWMVVLGSALAHMFLIPILQNFTLIFKDRFTELGFTSTDITTVVSLNASFGMIVGLLNGPILKVFGCRKVALAGSTLYVIGLLCTGIAKSYIEFVLFYGLLASLGMAMVMASFSLAINSYFLKNRSKAVSYTVTLTGIGPIVMPIVISYLLASYGLKWTVFLLSGLSLHAFVGALLLNPLKRQSKLHHQAFHREDKQSTALLTDVHSVLELPAWGSKMSLGGDPTGCSFKSPAVNFAGLLEANNTEVGQERQQRRKLSVTFMDNDDYKNMMSSTLHMIDGMDGLGKIPKCASAETLSLEHMPDLEKSLMEPLKPRTERNYKKTNQDTSTPFPENVKCGLVLRAVRYLRDIYDLDLFHDLSYINVLLGLSVAFAGEVIFSTMTPIILGKVGFGTEETATFVSVISGCDLLCRFIAPFVGKKLNLDSKKMYLIALVMLLISRTSMYLASTYETYLLVSLGLGAGKGFRSVFWVLVLPDYVPLSKLPSASAFQSLINGLLLLISGPIIGAIITLTDNYFNIVVASNVLTLTTIILWCGEIIYFKCSTGIFKFWSPYIPPPAMYYSVQRENIEERNEKERRERNKKFLVHIKDVGLPHS